MTASPGIQEFAIITGASTGIGAATARELARRESVTPCDAATPSASMPHGSPPWRASCSATPFAFDLVMLEIGAFHPGFEAIHLGPENALKVFKMLGGGMPQHLGGELEVT